MGETDDKGVFNSEIFDPTDNQYENKTEFFDDVMGYLTREGLVAPSSSSYHMGIWYYAVDDDTDVRTGEITKYTFHLEGFTDVEQRIIYRLVKQEA